MNTQIVSATEQIIPANWECSNTSFTSDELISAYLPGKKEGQELQQQKRRATFISNIHLATKTAEKFYAFLSDAKVVPHVRLRANSIQSFDFAFLLDQDTYLSDKLDEANSYAYELRKACSTDAFSVYFYLFPKTATLDLNLMISDGFSIFYEPKY
jgi:hypothetical protein